MAYRLEDGEPVADGIRRVAAGEIAAALVALVEAEDPDRVVHGIRLNLKRVRSLLRLVREPIGDEAFDRENRAYRAAGRLLAASRDSAVRLETLDGLVEHYDGFLAHDTFRDIRMRLRAERESARAALADGDVVGRVVRTLREGLGRIDGWAIGADGFEALRLGLERTYARGRKRMRKAYAEPSPERFHEWRKRVKDLWYQLQLLGRAWPAGIRPVAKELDRLQTGLGRVHDLDELDRAVRDGPAALDGAVAAEALRGLAAARVEALRTAARPVASRVYHEPPDAFADRIEAYWRVWRGGA